MLNIATPNGNRILNIENCRARILNIEFLRSRIFNIDPSVMISIFGVVTSPVGSRCVGSEAPYNPTQPYIGSLYRVPKIRNLQTIYFETFKWFSCVKWFLILIRILTFRLFDNHFNLPREHICLPVFQDGFQDQVRVCSHQSFHVLLAQVIALLGMYPTLDAPTVLTS